MHYTENEIYRPPLEARTPLLEVTRGCSHNKCVFCTMYQRTPFSLAPKENIISDLEELAFYYPNLERIYLLNGDPFALSFEKLKEIGELIHKYLPNIRTITSYASFYNMKNKTVAELRELKAFGFDELYIGLETAYEPALLMINKGCNLEEYKQTLGKLKEAGISYHAILMMGVAGRGNSEINAKATAEFLNIYPAKSVFPMTTSVQFGSELYKMREEGEFEEASLGEIIKAQIVLVENLDYPDEALFSSGHMVNLINISHRFKNKDKILEKLNYDLENLRPEILNSTNETQAR